MASVFTPRKLVKCYQPGFLFRRAGSPAHLWISVIQVCSASFVDCLLLILKFSEASFSPWSPFPKSTLFLMPRRGSRHTSGARRGAVILWVGCSPHLRPWHCLGFPRNWSLFRTDCHTKNPGQSTLMKSFPQGDLWRCEFSLPHLTFQSYY